MRFAMLALPVLLTGCTVEHSAQAENVTAATMDASAVVTAALTNIGGVKDDAALRDEIASALVTLSPAALHGVRANPARFAIQLAPYAVPDLAVAKLWAPGCPAHDDIFRLSAMRDDHRAGGAYWLACTIVARPENTPDDRAVRRVSRSLDLADARAGPVPPQAAGGPTLIVRLVLSAPISSADIENTRDVLSRIGRALERRLSASSVQRTAKPE